MSSPVLLALARGGVRKRGSCRVRKVCEEWGRPCRDPPSELVQGPSGRPGEGAGGRLFGESQGLAMIDHGV